MECSPNFPSASITRYTHSKSISNFFNNISDKNGCFLINCKVLKIVKLNVFIIETFTFDDENDNEYEI